MRFGFVEKINDFLSKWLFGRSRIRPDHVKILNNEIVVVSTEVNQRFLHSRNIKQFILEMPHVSYEDREKLGIALGKVIADNLVVSFDEVSKAGQASDNKISNKS